MNKLALIKGLSNLTHVKSINNLSLVKTIIEQVMRTRVLRPPIVFLRVRCSYCVRYSIPNFLIKTVLVTFVHCNTLHHSYSLFTNRCAFINTFIKIYI